MWSLLRQRIWLIALLNFSIPGVGQDTVPTAFEVKQLIQSVMPSIVTIRVKDRDGGQLSIGTGFVIDSSGLIATNYHVLTEGREFSVELWPKRSLKVLAVEASDRATDLAVIRVELDTGPLTALPLVEPEAIQQGLTVWAFGHPQGMQHSVAAGVLSAVREIEGRELLQLAMPIEPGNSGGPLVNEAGQVLGIVNLKSVKDQNLGFAVPINGLRSLMQNTNPILVERWVRFHGIDEARWTPVFGAVWQERSGVITARGTGSGFGGRSLCLAMEPPPAVPYEIAVQVKLDDESGAAGLVLNSDDGDRHYGFYPSNGRLRLTCFEGPSVYSWNILHDEPSPHYLSGDWNQLKVRVEKDSFKCYVNGQFVVESRDTTLSAGKVGLAKFRDTQPQFKRFQVADRIVEAAIDDESRAWLEQLKLKGVAGDSTTDEQLQVLAGSSEPLAREIQQRASELRQSAEQWSRLAIDLKTARALQHLGELLEVEDADDLLRGALWIACLDNHELEIEVYVRKLEQMSREILHRLPDDADESARLAQLNQYLFNENGFHGSHQEYYHAANSHLQRVIDDREGLPITMSILYIELARQIGLRVEGVALPGHFIVRHMPVHSTPQFIDVFEKGKLLTASEVQRMIFQNAQRLHADDDFRASSTQEILVRVLRNLIGSAQRLQDDEALVRYCSALVAIDPNEPQYRMMRSVARFRTGRNQGAKSDVEQLMEVERPGISREDLQRLNDAISERLQGVSKP